ncbi:Sushi, nidogen and EGF-like domain-containing protein 1 [Trichinella murrelli]|uniref:Sushi, nidogen and EGF-like domain-containing protein 1 n=1 Tax=Trichinella murrelli TaxID=144512 RepID=A0A0V0U9K6_9BILA|nr:Sushi, nidogen and EGF-like domain-containing protein 1 [Trichinella murrelli]
MLPYSEHTVELRMLVTVTAVAAALLVQLSPCSALIDDNYDIEDYISLEVAENNGAVKDLFQCPRNKICDIYQYPNELMQAMPYDLALALAIQQCKKLMVNGNLPDDFIKSEYKIPGPNSPEWIRSILPPSSKFVYNRNNKDAIVVNRNGTFSMIPFSETFGTEDFMKGFASLNTPLCISPFSLEGNGLQEHRCDLAKKYTHFICIGDKIRKCNHYDQNQNCICPPNRSGTMCEIKLSSSEYNPCQNGGTYYASLRGNICLCKSPYKGPYCKDKFLCYEKPCLNSGVCKSDNLTHHSCECRLPYWGERCENVNYCLEGKNPCNNGGTCVKIENLYKCICPPGYAEPFCRTDYSASYRFHICIGIASYLLVTTTIFCCVFMHFNKVYNGKFKLLEQGLLSEAESTVSTERKEEKKLNKNTDTPTKQCATDGEIKKPEKDYYVIPEINDEGFIIIKLLF